MTTLKHHVHTHRNQLATYLRNHRVARVIAGVSVLLLVAMVGLPLWRLAPIVETNPFIPLHYNIFLGVDRFGPWYEVFILPVLGIVILILNFALAALYSVERQTLFGLKTREPLLAIFLLWTTLAIEVILFAGMVFTLLLNL